MANDQKKNRYNSADIERYHSGQMNAADMHALEKASLDDPFLADALDGYADASINLSGDLDILQTRLEQRIHEKEEGRVIPMRRNDFTWWRVAAIVVFLVGAATLTYQFGFHRDEEQNIAKVETTSSNADSIARETASKNSTSNSESNTESNTVIESPDTIHNKTGKADLAAADQPVIISNAHRPVLTKEDATVPAAATAPVKKDAIAANRKKAASEVSSNATEKDSIALSGYSSGDMAMADKAKGRSFVASNVFKGRVMDAQNNALPFANITNTVDNVGTYTDAKGYFTLISSDSIMNVQVKSLGFENRNYQLNSVAPENRVTLLEDRSLSARVLDTVRRNAIRPRTSTMVLEEPEPADGWSNYDTYLVNNLNVPENFRARQNSGGEVQLSFEVNKLGEPINIKVEKSLCQTCDQEAIRLVKDGPKWKRKASKGRTTVTVPF